MTICLNQINWYLYLGALLPQTPPHQNIALSKEEQQELLQLSKAYFLRWTDDFDTLHETNFWYIVKDSREGLDTYKSKIRNQIKKGLNSCTVLPTDAKTIAKEGYGVFCNALKHYSNALKPMSAETFETNICSLDTTWEFWEVRNESGLLIAYSQNLIMDNTCNYSVVKLDPSYLHLYPAYALFFTMNLHYLNERKMRYVHDGSRSISHDTNIQNFLCEKFNFRKAYCTMHIAYRYDIALMVKLLYPFRRMFSYFNFSIFRKISTLLKHEEIYRQND